MNRRPTLSLAAAGMAIATLTASCGFDSAYDVPLPGGADLGANPMTVTVEFDDVLDLVPQSAVKVDDVSVGRVTDIETEDWNAVVTIKVRGSVDLPANSVAAIRQTSILGEKFISLEEPAKPSSAELSDGDEIPIERTGRNPEIEEVLGALSMVLNGGGVAQLQTISREVNRIIDGRENDIKSVIRRLGKFMGDIDRSKPQVVEALRNINRLGRSANQQTAEIKSALDELPQAIRVLEGQRDQFVRMLGKLDRFADVGTGVIRRSRRDMVANLRDLAPVLRNLNRSGSALVKSLRLLPTAPYPDSLVGETPQEARAYSKGDYMNADLTFNPDLKPIIDDLSPSEYRRMVRILGGGVSGVPRSKSENRNGRDRDSKALQRLLSEAGDGS